MSATKRSVEVYVLFLDIVLEALSFSNMITELSSGQFVKVIVPFL